MVKCSVLTFVLRHKTFSKVSHLRLASEDYLAFSIFIFVFPHDWVTGLLQGHPLMPIIIIKALYIHLSDELLSNWLVDETYWISSLTFWNMLETKWSRFDFSQYFNILPSLKVYKQFYLYPNHKCQRSWSSMVLWRPTRPLVLNRFYFFFFKPRLPWIGFIFVLQPQTSLWLPLLGS